MRRHVGNGRRRSDRNQSLGMSGEAIDAQEDDHRCRPRYSLYMVGMRALFDVRIGDHK